MLNLDRGVIEFQRLYICGFFSIFGILEIILRPAKPHIFPFLASVCHILMLSFSFSLIGLQRLRDGGEDPGCRKFSVGFFRNGAAVDRGGPARVGKGLVGVCLYVSCFQQRGQFSETHRADESIGWPTGGGLSCASAINQWFLLLTVSWAARLPPQFRLCLNKPRRNSDQTQSVCVQLFLFYICTLEYLACIFPPYFSDALIFIYIHCP